MSNTSTAILAALGVSLVCAVPSSAHHSTAMFDHSKEIVVEGTVKQWQFTNPHSWLQILVTQPDGKTVQWSFEGGAPGGGGVGVASPIAKDTFKPGEKVSVKTHPMKDGRPAGSLREVTFTDGRVWTARGGTRRVAPS